MTGSMNEKPEITVRKVGYYAPVNHLGTDEQGRTLVRCPSVGCGEPAYVAEDGRVVCPVAEAETAFLRRVMDVLDRALDTPRPGRLDSSQIV